MPKFRNIKVRMKGGKSRIQRAMVLASGKLKFVKNIGRRIGRRTPKARRGGNPCPRPKTRYNGGVRMARRYFKRKRGGGGKSLVRTAEKFIGLTALLGPGAVAVKRGMDMGGGKHIVIQPVAVYTGFNLETGEFSWQWLAQGWGPYIGFKVVSTIAHKINGILRGI